MDEIMEYAAIRSAARSAGADRYYVYVITETYSEFRKIGIARNIAARIRALQVGNPRPLAVDFQFVCRSKEIAAQVERRAHQILRDERLVGEWFSAPKDHVVAVVEQAAVWVKSRRGNIGCYDAKRCQVNLGAGY